jgi:hypothetical protein
LNCGGRLGRSTQPMVSQRDKGIGSPGYYQTGLPPVQTTEEVPRWLAILGLTAALTLFVALLRYAIDLLGVVFLIIVVGFSIRTVSDWLTEGESVSSWAFAAVLSGLAGTSLVMLWLFGSDPQSIAGRLPGPMMTTAAWLESHGWGQRVLLNDGAGGFRSGPQMARGGGAGSAGPIPAPSGPGLTLPSLSSSPSKRRSDSKDDGEPGVAEASSLDPRAKQPAERTRRNAGSHASTRGESASAAETSVPAADVDTSTTLLTASPSVLVGTSVRLTAVVSAGTDAGSPTGVVVFERGGVVIGTARLRSGRNGSTAALSTLSLPIGDHELIAVYPGASGFTSSRSAPVRQVVTRR